MKALKYYFAGALMLTTGLFAMTSCGNSGDKKAEDEGAALKAKIENCTDPDSIKIYADQARIYAEKLEADGKGEEAKTYLNEVIPVIQGKDSTAVTVFDQLKSDALKEVAAAKMGVTSVVDSIENAAANAVDSVKNAAGNAVDAAKGAAADAVNSAKDKANAAVNDAKDKAGAAVDNAKDKAKEAVNNAKQEAANKAKEGIDNLMK